MSYTTQQDILDFVEDNNVKFVRFAFCDIFGFQKNIAVLASDLPKALEDGVCFDGSAIAGFMHVEESDLVLRPDLSTMTILPWRTAEGRVMQFFCDVEKPDNTPFGGNCRGFLRDINRRFMQLGLRCNVGTECEFYLFENDDRGRPTRIPIDAGGYFDVAPLDAGENIRRDICLTMEQMGLAPQHSHHENGHGQNEIDFHYAGPLKTADNIFLFKQIVRAVAASNGFHSSFLPKPLPDQAGSGLHINLSLTMDGKNLFEGDIAPDSIPGSFMAGILRHSRELTAFTNPLPNSYLRFGCDEAPRYVSWATTAAWSCAAPTPPATPTSPSASCWQQASTASSTGWSCLPLSTATSSSRAKPPVSTSRPCPPRWKRPSRWPGTASSFTNSCPTS